MGETVAVGVQHRRRMKKHEKKWLKKPLKGRRQGTATQGGGKYLKSDNRMYAPLVIAQSMNVAAAKAIKPPHTGGNFLEVRLRLCPVRHEPMVKFCSFSTGRYWKRALGKLSSDI